MKGGGTCSNLRNKMGIRWGKLLDFGKESGPGMREYSCFVTQELGQLVLLVFQKFLNCSRSDIERSLY